MQMRINFNISQVVQSVDTTKCFENSFKGKPKVLDAYRF